MRFADLIEQCVNIDFWLSHDSVSFVRWIKTYYTLSQKKAIEKRKLRVLL
jgi:hypothetical protein